MSPSHLVCWLLFIFSTACATAATSGLTPYANEAELNAALEAWRSRAQALQAPMRDRAMSLGGIVSQGMAPAPAAAPQAKAAMEVAGAKAEASAGADSITNVQTAGVDEGGIVKQSGEHLIILRRGRLFTVKVGGDALRPVATIDAYAPGADPRGAWYDELLVAGRTVVVVGFSYQRGGTEIGLFELSPDGALSYRATYHLRSHDYYSSRNYASRLIGTRLVFYTPTLWRPWGAAPLTQMPAMRQWQPQLPQEFQRILPATRIYRSDDEFDATQPLGLHTVTSCELASQPLRCESSAVLGPAGRVFYVSAGSVYVWTATRRAYAAYGRPQPVGESVSALFRLPLDGATPSAIKSVGVPIDQLSFIEERDHLSVLLRDEGSGEAMFGGERGAQRLALLRLPLAALGDGKSAAAREHYRRLPGAGHWRLQNRHVGEWLLWGSGERAWALRTASNQEPVELNPGHAVERIEALGAHALLAGNQGDELRFSALRLGRTAALVGGYARPGARQGETRTHGFFYRPQGADEGLLGLPILGAEQTARTGLDSRGRGAASVVFLRQRDLQFTGLGELAARREGPQDDGCKASCVDWYGNARPIFIGSRIFALMGYELVEGALEDGSRTWGRPAEHAPTQINERRRIDFTPYAATRVGRPSPFQ